MKYIIKFVLVLSFVLTSCKNEKESEKKSNTPVIPFTEVGNQMRNEIATKSANQQTQNSTATSAQTINDKTLNPAHGQPNHQCDIPVGAPLNSVRTSQKTTPPITQQNQTVATKPVVTNTSSETTPTPEGMNPPHGQAGHQCGIAVGAALPKE